VYEYRFISAGFTDPTTGGEVNLTATTTEQIFTSPLFPNRYPM